MRNKVLIVDDDRAIAELTAMWLNNSGWESVIAGDGGSGLAAAARHRPEVIVLDIRMPDFDGFEFHRRLKENRELAAIPVIFLTANVHESARSQAMSSGAAAFLRKPYLPDQLLQTVSSALRQAQKSGECP
ncbi:MAG: phoP [Gemmatimonadetes bacterium]|nr:phoP [Gemmatimonadota bacterium]